MGLSQAYDYYAGCKGPDAVVSLLGGGSGSPMRRCTSAWDWCSAALTAAAPRPPLTSSLRSTVMLVDSQATTSSAVTDPSVRVSRLCCRCCCCCAAENQTSTARVSKQDAKPGARSMFRTEGFVFTGSKGRHISPKVLRSSAHLSFTAA